MPKSLTVVAVQEEHERRQAQLQWLFQKCSVPRQLRLRHTSKFTYRARCILRDANVPNMILAYKCQRINSCKEDRYSIRFMLKLKTSDDEHLELFCNTFPRHLRNVMEHKKFAMVMPFGVPKFNGDEEPSTFVPNLTWIIIHRLLDASIRSNTPKECIKFCML